ncbi:MAG: post-COAP-1 domain-containing protein [Actinomycetota bacterium]
MRTRRGTRGWVALAITAAVGVGLPVVAAAPAMAHPAGAIISNGTVQLGVWDEGHLNVPGGDPSSGTGTGYVGLRYVPTGAEATAPGCLCEGWGVADATTSMAGFANEAVDGVQNLAVESFVSDADSATSVVVVSDGGGGDLMRVTHDYQPSTDTPNLYEVTITIENTSAATIDPRYRRVMDWDVEPTAFFEYSTIQGTAGATDVSFASNNGFASANPLAGPSDLGAAGDFVDAGPSDHGALFDFDFEDLPAGESKTFTTFYGAAASETAANAALAAVGAEVYSYGQPSSSDPTAGEPNTFIFAFEGVGGDPVFPEVCDNGIDDDGDGLIDAADPDCIPVLEPTTTTYGGVASVQYSDGAALSGTLVDGSLAGVAGKTLDFTVGSQSTSGGPTDAAGAASASLVVTQQPGTVTQIATSFAGDATHAASADADPFAILKEDCTLTYSGDTTVAPLANTNLSADMGEPDASLGDRSGKTVVFTVTDSALVSQTFNAVTDASGHATTSQPLPVDVYAVSASFAGDDFYEPCATADETIVTVQQAGSKATGGGWFTSGSRASFGLNLIPQAGGTWKGQIQVRVTNTKAKFHGNTVTSAVALAPNKVRWTGTGRWNGVAGYTFEVTVVDNGTSGKKGDTIDVRIYPTGSPGSPVYTSGGAMALKGGNLVVHR